MKTRASELSVAIAAGGTAGHVNPALALADELCRRGYSVRFFGEARRLEGSLVPQAGFEFFPVRVSGFDRERPWTILTALAHLAREEGRLVNIFRQKPQLAPDVAIGFGAYVELPLMHAAKKLEIPIVLHEQNSIPGLANKLTAKHASLIATALPGLEDVFAHAGAPRAAVRFVGNPVRASVLQGSRVRGRAHLHVRKDETLLLIFGGSLGAHHLNERMIALKDTLLSFAHVRVFHSTGAEDFEHTRSALALSPHEEARWELCPYIENMGDALAAADLVLSRAGASSIAEIAAMGVPSILVPYPHATADHQTTNAHFLVDAGAALLFADQDIEDESFAVTLIELLSQPARREEMRGCAKGLGQDRAAERFADALEEVLDIA